MSYLGRNVKMSQRREQTPPLTSCLMLGLTFRRSISVHLLLAEPFADLVGCELDRDAGSLALKICCHSSQRVNEGSFARKVFSKGVDGCCFGHCAFAEVILREISSHDG